MKLRCTESRLLGDFGIGGDLSPDLSDFFDDFFVDVVDEVVVVDVVVEVEVVDVDVDEDRYITTHFPRAPPHQLRTAIDYQ